MFHLWKGIEVWFQKKIGPDPDWAVHFEIFGKDAQVLYAQYESKNQFFCVIVFLFGINWILIVSDI